MRTANIKIVSGDLFACSAEALVCPVNTRGAMGKGLAKVFAEKWPRFEYVYKLVCARASHDQEVMRDGIMHHLTAEKDAAPRILIAAATKTDWRKPSNLHYVHLAAKSIVAIVNYQNTKNIAFEKAPIKSIAVPALGCGLGGLDFEKVKPLLRAIMKSALVNDVFLFEPS